MTGLRFGEPLWAYAFWILPALFLLFLFSFWRKRRALCQFAASALLRTLLPTVSWGRQYVRCAVLLGGFALLVVTLMRPQWGVQKVELAERGIDIMVLLDTSRSMLAEDVAPNRLERAKTDVRYLVGALTGDRIGLVAFAGTGAAQVLCPLTFDYGFFLTLLDEATVGTVALGGTAIGDAIRKAVDCFQDEVRNYKIILLITDGEDQDSFPEKAAEKAREKGIRIFCIGLGDEAPTPIPVKDESGKTTFVTDAKGEIHKTRLDARTLTAIAHATEGKFFPARTAAIDLAQTVYREHIAVLPQRELAASREEHYVDRYQIFLAGALLLFMLEPFIRTRRREA
jgi:Ca-activated chloride channel homolog